MPRIINRIKTDAETNAFAGYIIGQGYTISYKEMKAIDYLVKALKVNGIWAKKTLIYVYVGGVSGTCGVNLKNPGYKTLSFVNAVSGNFTSSGFKAERTATPSFIYADTGLNINTCSNTDLSFATYNISATRYDGIDIGVYNNGGFICELVGYNNYTDIALFMPAVSPYTNASVQGGSLAQKNGFFAANYDGSVLKAFNLGNMILSVSNSSPASMQSYNILIGTNQASSGVWSRIYAYSDWGLSMTDEQHRVHYRIVENFQKMLGRQVIT